jgi:alkaline phosphatase D
MKTVALLIIQTLFFIYPLFAQKQGLERKHNADKDSYLNPLFAPFYHGVASGDPLPNAVIIWTRFTPLSDFDQDYEIFYEVATDLDFSQIVNHGTHTTNADSDYTVKLDITGLEADTYYFYRFMYANTYSIIGRTKTTPVASVNNLKFAVLSGSDFTKGFYTGLAKISERNDIDAVIHTGDYIYEHGNLGEITREHYPAAEIYLLQDYRNRLSQYRLDTNLQRCHQLYPWIVIWDDHDIVVDALRDTSYRHNPAFGLYSARKYAAIKAFREWIPCRDPEIIDENDFYKNWQYFSYGNLVDMYSLDVRLYDRDNWPENIFSPEYNSPDIKIIGPEQMDWITSHLYESEAQWKIIINGLMFSHFKALGYPLVMENWDGYPYERNQILNHLEAHNISNLVFLSGDFHCSFGNNVPKNPYNNLAYNPITGNGSLAVEFIPPSLSSDNFDEGNDYGLGSAAVASALITASNPHMRLVELEGHGYILLDITAERAQAEFWFMENIQDPENTNEYLHGIRFTQLNENKLQSGNTPSLPKPFQPDIPPFAPSIVNYSEIQPAPVVLSSYPNPFKSLNYTNIVLEKSMDINISLINVNSQYISTIFNGKLKAGNYTFIIDGNHLAEGIYYIKLLSGTSEKTIKLVKNK